MISKFLQYIPHLINIDQTLSGCKLRKIFYQPYVILKFSKQIKDFFVLWNIFNFFKKKKNLLIFILAVMLNLLIVKKETVVLQR